MSEFASRHARAAQNAAACSVASHASKRQSSVLLPDRCGGRAPLRQPLRMRRECGAHRAALRVRHAREQVKQLRESALRRVPRLKRVLLRVAQRHAHLAQLSTQQREHARRSAVRQPQHTHALARLALGPLGPPPSLPSGGGRGDRPERLEVRLEHDALR